MERVFADFWFAVRRQLADDGLLVLVHFVFTFLIAASPRVLGALVSADRELPSYAELTEGKVAAAPSLHVLVGIGAVFSAVAASASVVVCIEGGDQSTFIGLAEYWILQCLIAAHFHVFFNIGAWLLGCLLLFVALIVCSVDVYFFWQSSPAAGTLLLLFAAWPLYVLVIALKIVANNSEREVQERTRALSRGKNRGKLLAL